MEFEVHTGPVLGQGQAHVAQLSHSALFAVVAEQHLFFQSLPCRRTASRQLSSAAVAASMLLLQGLEHTTGSADPPLIIGWHHEQPWSMDMHSQASQAVLE